MLRIALISYEFPPAIAIGGIGTYTLQAAKMLANAGHQVHVFAAGVPGKETEAPPAVTVHRVGTVTRDEFRSAAAEAFQNARASVAFDIIESPEVNHEASVIWAAHPAIARVVKLHTPTSVLQAAGFTRPTWRQQVRFIGGALRRGRIRWLPLSAPDGSIRDPEAQFAHSADEIAAPSASIAAALQELWQLQKSRVSQFPYPFIPRPEYLDVRTPVNPYVVGFLGRLEPRKGILELARAIPRVLNLSPHTTFRLIGPTWPFGSTDVVSWVRAAIPQSLNSIEFVGAVSPSEVPAELAKCGIVVLPSRWESFGFVCAEAMAAGRAVVASRAGGMSELIEDGRSGLLIDGGSPDSIVKAILRLQRQPTLAESLAEAGRDRILNLLSPASVLPLQEASYKIAIQRAQERKR